MRLIHLHHPVHKTLAFAAMHVAVAIAVGWALTGSFVIAGALALIEPALNTLAYHFFERAWRRRAGPQASLLKVTAFGGLHLLIAVAVGWALTGSLVIAGALALIEPAANSVALYFFDRWWHRRVSRLATA